jgi:molybdopterin synthase sulfur carrier subunit
MKINVMFFGIIADKIGSETKEYNNIKNIDTLIFQIESDFPQVKKYNYQVSVNREICNENVLLKDNDEIALLPPFAGG